MLIMLILKFQVGSGQFAVDSARVSEVIPWVALRPVPRAPHYLKGLFHYRGQVVSVIDLAELMGASACQPRLSSRLIVVKQSGDNAGRSPCWRSASTISSRSATTSGPVRTWRCVSPPISGR